MEKASGVITKFTGFWRACSRPAYLYDFKKMENFQKNGDFLHKAYKAIIGAFYFVSAVTVGLS